MSEGSERKLEGLAAEAEAIEQKAPGEGEPAAEPKAEPARQTGEDVPAPERKGEPEKKKKKKKKRGARSAILPLVIALVIVLVIFAVLVGYGLGRVRGARDGGAPEAQPSAEVLEEDAGYDIFAEELTNENQQALNALSGADGLAAADGNASELMGEDDFFVDDAAQQGSEAAEPVVVAEYGDGQTLMSDEVLEAYNEQLASYILSGYSEEEVAETLLDDVLQSMVSERLEADHAREMGLYEISDEDRAEIEAQAQAELDEYIAFCRQNQINTEGMTDEEADGAAKAYLLENEGISLDALIAQMEDGLWEQKLYEALTRDVTVDDAQVRAAYDARLAEQKQNFTDYPDDFEFSQRNGEIILYNPPGYRAVKELLLGFDDEETAMAVYALTDELFQTDEAASASEEERQAELDGYYAGPEARAQQALEQLRGGADMDELIESIGADEGMMDERLRAMGYYVSADSMLWPEAVVQAAMALESVGDYSEPLRVEDGVCILQYLGDVTEGEVPYESVRDALREEVLEEARSEAYERQVQTWLEEAKPSYYPERMQ